MPRPAGLLQPRPCRSIHGQAAVLSAPVAPAASELEAWPSAGKRVEEVSHLDISGIYWH